MGPMVYLADLVRCMKVAENNEELENMAKCMGLQKKDSEEENTDSHVD